jgi:two-component system, NtrC family, sensor kinase
VPPTAEPAPPTPPPPRSTIATRVLASFAITVVGFVLAVGWGIVAQRRAADDNVELTRGYVPVALKLGQLRATQTALRSLVDNVSDERTPISPRVVLEPLAMARRTKFSETRLAMTQGFPVVSEAEVQRLASYAAELDAIDTSLSDDPALFEELFGAIATNDRDRVNELVLTLGTLELDAERRLHVLADKVSSSMDELSAAAYARERRAVYMLLALATLTLVIGIAVSIRTRRLLAPLARVTERAKAVARGDLTPREVEPTDDEIGQLAAAFEKMVAGVARAQALALSNERLAAIGKMAAHVTHEIRNPLSSIGLNMELLEEELAAGGRPQEARQLLGSIKRELERLEHLSEEYLRVARLPSPRMEADDVSAAVKEIVAFARPEIEHASCSVALHIDGKVPAALFDESQLRQSLLNLLRNAREAMPSGGPIDVTVEAEGMSVVISVDDRGGGIPDDIRARVFDPFFSTKGEGTGLGLAITRHIVEAHGGSVTCEPREGGGTRFRIALPIAPSRAAAPLRMAAGSALG